MRLMTTTKSKEPIKVCHLNRSNPLKRVMFLNEKKQRGYKGFVI